MSTIKRTDAYGHEYRVTPEENARLDAIRKTIDGDYRPCPHCERTGEQVGPGGLEPCCHCNGTGERWFDADADPTPNRVLSILALVVLAALVVAGVMEMVG